jgi:hypothetical protein
VLMRQNSQTCSLQHFYNVINIVSHSLSVFQDSLLHFCHTFSRGSWPRSSTSLIVFDRHPPFFETLKPFIGLG